jgi:hypothetical protein
MAIVSTLAVLFQGRTWFALAVVQSPKNASTRLPAAIGRGV